MVALAFSDRQMLRRMWVIFGATVAQMAIVVGVVALGMIKKINKAG
jgi:putative ubiquitin-RnfH superfamily antitoxin RatB of RatAB toxin-antitoxin module